MDSYIIIYIYVICLLNKEFVAAFDVAWSAGDGFKDESWLYVNGNFIRKGINSGGIKTSYNVPTDAKVLAWLVNNTQSPGSIYYLQVTYNNLPWSWKGAPGSQCWKCTHKDVSAENWYDIDYDDSLWDPPGNGKPSAASRIYSLTYAKIIYCRHNLPVSKQTGQMITLSNNKQLSTGVYNSLKDGNTDTCTSVFDIVGTNQAVIKVEPELIQVTACTFTMNIKNLDCSRLKIYTHNTQDEGNGPMCPNIGSMTRLDVVSQTPATNGTDSCLFSYSQPTCATCCSGCSKAVFLHLRGLTEICEIIY